MRSRFLAAIVFSMFAFATLALTGCEANGDFHRGDPNRPDDPFVNR